MWKNQSQYSSIQVNEEREKRRWKIVIDNTIVSIKDDEKVTSKELRADKKITGSKNDEGL